MIAFGRLLTPSLFGTVSFPVPLLCGACISPGIVTVAGDSQRRVEACTTCPLFHGVCTFFQWFVCTQEEQAR